MTFTAYRGESHIRREDETGSPGLLWSSHDPLDRKNILGVAQRNKRQWKINSGMEFLLTKGFAACDQGAHRSRSTKSA